MSDDQYDSNGSLPLPELFEQAVTLLDPVVRRAFLHYDHPPTPEDLERFHQRLSLLLLKDDYRRLRTFDQRAQLSTWLQTVVNHEVAHFLQREGRSVALEDAPPATFYQPATQEEILFAKEQAHLVKSVARKLSKRQRQLYELIRQDLSDAEIAGEMNLKVESVYRKKIELEARLEELVNGKGQK